MTQEAVLRIPGRTLQAMAAFDADRLGWMDRATATGPTARLQVGRLSLLVTTEPQVARWILQAGSDNWTRPRSFLVSTRIAAGQNLFTLPTDKWELLGPTVNQALRLKSLGTRLARLSPILESEVASWPSSEEFDLDHATSRMALRSAIWLTMGCEPDSDELDELVWHQRAIVDWLGRKIDRPSSILPFSASRDLRGHRQAIYAFITRCLRNRRQGEPDAFSAVVEAHTRNGEVDQRAVCEHMTGLIGVGNEVTAATLSWALVFGSQRPEDFAATASDRDAADRFVSETLRLASCAWSITRAPRRAVTLDTVTGSIRCSRWTPVVVYLRGMHRDPLTWDRGQDFLPERHRELNQEQRQSFMPFGLGPRQCVGQQMARAELIAAVRAMASLGKPHLSRQPQETAGFAVRVADGLHGRFDRIQRGTS